MRRLRRFVLVSEGCTDVDIASFLVDIGSSRCGGIVVGRRIRAVDQSKAMRVLTHVEVFFLNIIKLTFSKRL